MATRTFVLAGLAGVLFLLVAAPALAAPPQPFSIQCPLTLASEIEIPGALPNDLWNAPPDWTEEYSVYGYLYAQIPIVDAFAYKGTLYCRYGIPRRISGSYQFPAVSTGYWLARISRKTPKGFWCSVANESDFIGFDCNPW